MAADEEDRDGKTCGILTILISSVEGHAFGARVICDMLVVVRYRTSLELPPAGRVVNVGERLAGKLQNQSHIESPLGRRWNYG